MLEGWAKKVGWEVLLNRAGTTFKKLPDADKDGLTEKKAIALMLAQPSMIKRPVLEKGQDDRRLQAGRFMPRISMSIYVGVGGWVFRNGATISIPRACRRSASWNMPARQADRHRDQRHLLRLAEAGKLCRWHDETPDDFVFTLKGPRFATNRRVLAEAGRLASSDSSPAASRGLKKKLGPLNWQFMATKKFDAEDFGAFLKLLPHKA